MMRPAGIPKRGVILLVALLAALLAAPHVANDYLDLAPGSMESRMKQ